MKEFYYTYSKHNKGINVKQYIYSINYYNYNWHNDLELLIVMSGKVEVCTNGESKVLEEDDMILINSNMGHATLAQEPNSAAMVIHIDPVFLKDYYKDIELLSFNLCSTKETKNEKSFALIRYYLSQMILCSNKETPENKLSFEITFYSLIHTIIINFPPIKIKCKCFIKNEKNFNTINKMVKYIDKNYKKKITLERLAKESGYNRNYVSQFFKLNLGINFYDYLTRIRLREATWQLSQSNDKILEIALDNGFPDIKAFNLAFKDNFGKSPTEYRNQLKNKNLKNHTNFKRQFISINNNNVNDKLKSYINYIDSYSLENTRKNNLIDNKKFDESIKYMEELSYKFKTLSDELSQRTNYLKKDIKDLS
ncbi:MAG: helix-turn-helix domain-containing protein [Clostridium perfringens]|nr:helix-turn-helix domain-containing protein [Clostridium perfringens]